MGTLRSNRSPKRTSRRHAPGFAPRQALTGESRFGTTAGPARHIAELRWISPHAAPHVVVTSPEDGSSLWLQQVADPVDLTDATQMTSSR